MECATAGIGGGFFEHRPSGPPPASQRRPSSVVIRGGRMVCDHAARTPAASFVAGRDVPGRSAARVARFAVVRSVPGNRRVGSCTTANPARPGGRWSLDSVDGTRNRSRTDVPLQIIVWNEDLAATSCVGAKQCLGGLSRPPSMGKTGSGDHRERKPSAPAPAALFVAGRDVPGRGRCPCR